MLPFPFSLFPFLSGRLSSGGMTRLLRLLCVVAVLVAAGAAINVTPRKQAVAPTIPAAAEVAQYGDPERRVGLGPLDALTSLAGFNFHLGE